MVIAAQQGQAGKASALRRGGSRGLKHAPNTMNRSDSHHRVGALLSCATVRGRVGRAAVVSGSGIRFETCWRRRQRQSLQSGGTLRRHLQRPFSSQRALRPRRIDLSVRSIAGCPDSSSWQRRAAPRHPWRRPPDRNWLRLDCQGCSPRRCRRRGHCRPQDLQSPARPANRARPAHRSHRSHRSQLGRTGRAGRTGITLDPLRPVFSGRTCGTLGPDPSRRTCGAGRPDGAGFPVRTVCAVLALESTDGTRAKVT